MNAWRTPGWIFNHHAEDEFAQFTADALPACASPMSREPGPVQLEPRAVPSHHGLRLNENQRVFSPQPEASQDYPECLVTRTKPRLRMPLSQNSELLPKSQVFQEQVAARTKNPVNKNRQKPQQA